MAYFPLLTSPSSHQSTGPQQTHQSPPAQQQPQQQILANRLFDQARAEDIIQRNGGYELVISPLYKRFLAEVLDTIILFVIKIVIFVVIIDLFDINIALDIDIEDLKDMKFLEDDYMQLLNFSSEFILLEILTKIVSCLYEATFNVKFGATIGKLVMGVRILHADAVIPLEQQVNHSQGIRALIYPAQTLTFVRFLQFMK
jgi:RDD family